MTLGVRSIALQHRPWPQVKRVGGSHTEQLGEGTTDIEAEAVPRAHELTAQRGLSASFSNISGPPTKQQTGSALEACG